MKKYIFGIDLGGTSVKLGLFDTEGKLLDKWEIPTRVVENDNESILRDITASIKEKQAERGIADEEVQGAGIAVPGPVLEDGTVNRCVNLKWGVFNVAQALSRLSGFPVKVGNDANAAALGEQYRGVGRGCRSLVLITLGTGVGSGVIINGQIVPGAFGAGGEVGHMHVRDNEPDECGCGRHGCLEQYASAKGIERLARYVLAEHPELTTRLGKDAEIECISIFTCAHEGDPGALAVVEAYFDLLGRAAANISCVVDPECIVFGGGVSKQGSYLSDGIATAYRKYCFHASSKTRILCAALGNDAGIYGACAMAAGN